MSFLRLRFRGLAAALLLALSLVPAEAATLRIATLKFGTVNWLLDTMAAEGLDARHGVAVERVEFAAPQALTVALQAGEVDLIVSDWLWAMRQRSQGERLAFAPYSSALGALMAPHDGPIRDVADLAGSGSAWPGARSTRSGCCSAPGRAAPAATSPTRPSRSMARPRSSPSS